MASQLPAYLSPAPPPLQDFPPLGAGSPPGQEFFRGDGRPPQNNMNGNGNPQRMSGGDWRSNASNAGKAIPSGPHHSNTSNPGHRPFGSGQSFDGPRSPPNAKNTAHVPCKFFKLGQCQAGKACPFSHSTDASKYEQPCKYFSKGNCKFGQKCALLHVLPNGRVINNPNRNGGNLNIGNRVDPPPYPNQESALGNSLIAQQVGGMPQPFNHQIPHIPDYDPGLHVPPRSQPFDIPQPNSKFGTPKEEPHQAMSPIPHLTTLDAPLPASFDSNGISYMAIHGPVAASMPPRVGHESPSTALLKKVNYYAEHGLQSTADSGFGNSGKSFNLGSSPLGPSNDAVGQRMMHSQRVTRQNRLSASLPRTMEHEWEHDHDDMLFGNEEEWIPAGLAHLMTPEERNRRTSGKVENPNAIRESLAGNNPNELTTKIGSPSNASPSRYSVWNKPKTDDDSSGFPSPSFGPVGSPLRNATLHPGASPSLRAVRGAGDLAFKVSSPPRYSSTSMLSQQLQRTRLSSRASESSETSSGGLHPNRHTSNPRSVFDRAVSSNSVTAERIDEEQPEMVFSLEEEEYGSSSHSKSNANIWGPAGINRNASGQKNNINDKETNRNTSK